MPKLKVYSPEVAYTVAPLDALTAMDVPTSHMQADAYVVATSKTAAAGRFAFAGGSSSPSRFTESRDSVAQALSAAGLLDEEGTVLVTPLTGYHGPKWVVAFEDLKWRRVGQLTRGYPVEFVPET